METIPGLKSPPAFTPIETARLVLRRFTMDDLQVLVAYRSDPQVARFQSWDTYTEALGAGLITMTYSVWLSAQVGRWIFVEDHASISMTAYTGIIRTAPPSPIEEGLALAEALVTRPQGFLPTFTRFLRSNFRPAAQRWVDLYLTSLTGTPRLVT